jgi:uncharacterized protein (TIGR03083 family)
MPDERELAAFDPFDCFDQEAGRLLRWFLHRSGDDWRAPTRCDRWDVQDLLAHLAAGEEYNQACIAGRVQEYMIGLGNDGVTSLDTANAKGVADRRSHSPAELLEEWKVANETTRRQLRALGDGDLQTSVGPYPARWQAWHLTSELATHADDAAVPITDDEYDERLAWRTAFARFALAEAHPELDVELEGDRTLVSDPGGDLTLVLDDEVLVDAVNNRLGSTAPLDPTTRRRLSTV